MQDFKSYAKEKKNANEKSNSFEGLDGDALSQIEEFAKAYEGASEEQLITAILKEAKSRKDAGTLSNSEIDSFANMLRPMLNPSQVKKLEKIVNKLKK